MSQPAGKVIERGTLPDGREYRVWQRYGDGKLRVYVGDKLRNSGGRGTCHNMRWLRNQLGRKEER